MSQEACRIDLWLWHARFLKTRALAARFVEDGRVRLERPGLGPPARLDKPSRTVRPGDQLTFAIAARVFAIRIEALSDRRGPAEEAQRLYSYIADPGETHPNAPQ